MACYYGNLNMDSWTGTKFTIHRNNSTKFRFGEKYQFMEKYITMLSMKVAIEEKLIMKKRRDSNNNFDIKFFCGLFTNNYVFLIFHFCKCAKLFLKTRLLKCKIIYWWMGH